MGAVADGVLNGGGIIGVIPDFKIKRNRSQWIDRTGIVVDSMHERKTKMNDLCDALLFC
jgi:predicted Rossmann-fold nucleotide-binding protein